MSMSFLDLFLLLLLLFEIIPVALDADALPISRGLLFNNSRFFFTADILLVDKKRWTSYSNSSPEPEPEPGLTPVT
jgi:hypothetical protein